MKKLLIMSLLLFWSCDDVFLPCDVEILGDCYSIEHTTKINLASKELTSIPEEISLLKNLTSLSLSYNNLKEIPVEITSLTKLQYLYLNDNKINKMEYSLSELSELKFLNISNNQINDVINDSICSLINNTYININGNEIQRPLPSCVNDNFGFSVYLWGNEYPISSTFSLDEYISGYTIPKEIAFLKNLDSIKISGADGNIPAEIGELTELALLEINGDFLSGTIPEELGNLVNLVSLNLSSGILSGTIPEEFENLVNLESLDLSDNELSGAIPEELGSLVNLESLNLSSNDLSGTIPEELGSLVNLESLYLSYNELSGSIPENFINLINLKRIYLKSNQLSGLIPVSLCEIQPYIYGYYYTFPFLDLGSFYRESRNIDLTSNNLCRPYPTCFDTLQVVNDFISEPYIGQQSPEDCD